MGQLPLALFRLLLHAAAVERDWNRRGGLCPRCYSKLVLGVLGPGVTVLPPLISSSYLLPLSSRLPFLLQNFLFHMASHLKHCLCTHAVPGAPEAAALLGRSGPVRLAKGEKYIENQMGQWMAHVGGMIPPPFHG